MSAITNSMAAAASIAAALSVGWKNAANELKKWLATGVTVEEIRQVSSMGSGTWKKLLDILGGTICPELSNVPPTVYNLMRLLSLTEQRNILTHGIDMAVWDVRTQSFTSRKVMPGQLKPAEARLVFGFGLVRTLTEQQNYIQESTTTAAKGMARVKSQPKTIYSIEKIRIPYDIRAKDVVFWFSPNAGVSVQHTTLASITQTLRSAK